MTDRSATLATAIEPTQLLQEHAAGDSFRTLGKRYRISHEKARQMVSEAVDDLAFDAIVRMYSAWRNEQAGLTAEWPGFVVPHQAQPDRQIALTIFQAVTDRLKARSVPLKVVTRHVAPGDLCVGGVAFLWTLDQDELDRREHKE
jgi:hypothetical protein